LGVDGNQAAPDVRELHLSQGAGQRVVAPAFRGLADRVRRASPQGRVESLNRQVELAGLTNQFPVELVLLSKFALGGGVLAAWLFTPLREVSYAIPLGALTVFIFFFLPDNFVIKRAQARQLTIEHDLADSLDQITMSVEAGLGFEGAIERVVGAGTGPLNDELRRMLLEMQLGASRSDALRHLADRTDVADLKSFVFAIVQSEAYGLPIARVLRVQAAELRDKRRQRAEERALKIPVLLIFPLAFGIFPALFIVLLGPAAIRIFRDLGPSISP
jgi:tight adherence protein C